MKVSKLLRIAGEKVREKGWAKYIRQVPSYGSAHGVPGACCALGAIEYALWDTKLLERGAYLESSVLGKAARDEFAKHVTPTPAVARADRNTGYRIADWNNQVAQTADEVIATFNAAAACAEAQSL